MAEWRVGHQGRDMMYYEERHGGTWLRLEIQGEMLMGRAHHVIYFDPPARWQYHPEWARDRREEIMRADQERVSRARLRIRRQCEYAAAGSDAVAEASVVVRADEPVMFWVSIGLYGVIGVGALGLGAWGAREGRKLQKRR